MQMFACPVCEGRKVTGRIIHGESGQTFHLFGLNLPSTSFIVDRPCGTCKGTGEVNEQKYRALTDLPQRVG